jgi:sugar/nucleoside kinase (ribokinase family)
MLLREGSSEPEYFSIESVEQVDATGAGDIFRAIFASAIVSGKSVEQAIAKAQEISSASVAVVGVNNTLESLKL